MCFVYRQLIFNYKNWHKVDVIVSDPLYWPNLHEQRKQYRDSENGMIIHQLEQWTENDAQNKKIIPNNHTINEFIYMKSTTTNYHNNILNLPQKWWLTYFVIPAGW